MAIKLADRVKETTATSGTGAKVLLGAVAGWSGFDLFFVNNDLLLYAEANGDEWETGLGRYVVAGTERRITRVDVLSNSNGTTTPISWPAGTREIYATLPASKALSLDDNDEFSINRVLKLQSDALGIHFAFGDDKDFGLYDFTNGIWVWQYLADYNDVIGDHRLRVYKYTYFNEGGADIWSIGPNQIKSAAFAEAAGPITGTAQAGASTSITLASGASSTNDAYKDMLITLTGGLGNGQIKYIRGYNGTTKVATVELPWATTPNSTTVYSIKSGPANSGKVAALESNGRLHPDYMPTAVGGQLTAAGIRGVPKEPAAGEHTKFLKGDNTWGAPLLVYPANGATAWQTSWGNGGTYEFTHGLGGMPDQAWATFECVTTEYGIPVGRRVQYGTYGENGSSRGISVFFDATKIYVRIPANGVELARLDNTAAATITPANWKVQGQAMKWGWGT
jgi:hypothetical protein